MFSIHNLSVHFTGEFLFDSISFLINERDKIGLTGKNGAGKTTLMRIICKEIQPTEGTISSPADKTIGYLPQEKLITSKETVIEETLKAFEQVIAVEREMEQLNEALSTREDYQSKEYLGIITRLNQLTDQYNLMEGENRQALSEKVLLGLGFKPDEFSRPLDEFSGGWQMRVELAKILLKKPNLLLLDEPTNHLDIESIQWLEEFLKSYPGAVMLVSHDRRFLDAVTNRTIEISLGKIYDYPVAYSQYVLQRQERREKQLAEKDNQQREIAQIERFVERFRYKATKAKQVQSRVKRLEKLETIQVDQADNTTLHFQFPPAPRSGKVVLHAEDLTKAYGSKTVLKNISFGVKKGEFIAFVGRNGEGKTTLAKIIAEGLPCEGTLKHGHEVKIGYFAQNQAERLNPKHTVYESMEETATTESHPKIRKILGAFLFTGDDIHKKVNVLSGGEKTRLSLARMLMQPVNLLVLDEPTNHLDMTSKDILKNALLQFDGTMIVVSHDRDFLQGLTHKVFEFKNQQIHQHIGDINHFMEKRKLQTFSQLEQKNNPKTKQKNKKKSPEKKQYHLKKELEKSKRKLEKNIKRTEEKIQRLENETREMTQIMKSPEKLMELNNQKEYFQSYEKKQKELENLMEEWENHHLKLEEFISSESSNQGQSNPK